MHHGHLLIEEIRLQPGQEWSGPAAAWRFVRVQRGAAYWISDRRTRSLVEGEMILLGPKNQGAIRASQIGEVVMHSICFMPELLSGFFTVAERHFFDNAAAGEFAEARFFPSTHPTVQRFAELAAAPEQPLNLVRRAELLTLIVSLFNGDLERQRPAASRATSAEHRFQQLICKMPDTEFIKHTPEDLSRLCGCSPRHFSRLFQQHFHTSARERQSELRLLKAKQLLSGTAEKVITVALDCGYRNVSLFNSTFKSRFAMTPSEYRRRSARAKNLPQRFSILATLFFLLAGHVCAATTNGLTPAKPPLILGTPASPEDRAKAHDALVEKMRELNRAAERMKLFPIARTNSAATTNGTAFEVKSYDLQGNTVLPPDTVDLILHPYTGPAVSIAQIKMALSDLQLAYRELGYATIAVSLPPQQLTNGIVKVKVTEGRLVAINVLNNRYFSSNDVMRALPSLRTNILLNANVLQRELDSANANRDRQISPVVAPGPEPGTSVLELRVKDRLPLHARVELNNENTPNTPSLRANFNATYGNLWGLGHLVGVQYSFTPSDYKTSLSGYTRNGTNIFQVKDYTHNASPFDEPLIANYSIFYRMPLGHPEPVQQKIDSEPLRFGYNESTRRFELPPASSQPELSFYASRSTSGTGLQLGAPRAVTTNNPLLNIYSEDSGADLTLNESFGAKLSAPLRNDLANGVRAIGSFGIDFKRYRLASFNTNNFLETVTFTNSSGQITTNYTVSSGQPTRFLAVDSLPLNAGLNLAIPDRFGITLLDATLNANLLPVLSGDSSFAQAAYSPNARSRYVTLAYGIARDQRFYQDWAVLMRFNGQIANSALLPGEVFDLGGPDGVRAYQSRVAWGDSGWRIQLEPHSPYLKLGMVDGTLPMLVRVCGFFDYGQAYLHESAPQTVFTLAGTGLGVNGTIGSHLDFRLQIGIALHETHGPIESPVRAGDVRVTFALGAQF